MSDIRNNPARSRYELDVDGHVAFVEYRLSPGMITFTHTEVPKELSGRGAGTQLVRGALAAARADGLKVVAKCPFVSGYIQKHPEYTDLLA